MDTELLIENPIKLKYTTITIKIKNCIFNENSRPVKLTTTKNIEFIFPELIEMNIMRLTQLKNFLIQQKSVTITHDNNNRIHKIENLILNWNESNKYKLMILSWTKGLLFNDYVEVSAFENINKFYKKYDYVKFWKDGLEITIIIKDILPVDIPLKY